MRLPVAAALIATTGIALAQPALAQPALVELRDDVIVTAFGLSVDRVDDLDVHAGGRRIGDVEDVLGTQPSTATALVVDFDDDAGYGDRDDVVVPIGRFRLDGNRLITDVTPAEVATFPAWDD